MRVRFAAVAAGTVAALALAVAVPGGIAGDGEKEKDKPTYVGDGKCMKCHSPQHKAWKKSPLAESLKTLLPTTEADDKVRFEKKKKANLDPAKDYSGDEKCLKCHTTGYGLDGGYPKDPKANEELAKKMGKVACEACHGPGSLYARNKEDEMKKNPDAKFTFEGLASFGLVKPDEKVCATCHNKDSPLFVPDAFKFEEAKGKVHPTKK